MFILTVARLMSGEVVLTPYYEYDACYAAQDQHVPHVGAARASLHCNLEGRLYRGSGAEKGFQLSLITPFEIGV
jgi:hypothetical protein